MTNNVITPAAKNWRDEIEQRHDNMNYWQRTAYARTFGFGVVTCLDVDTWKGFSVAWTYPTPGHVIDGLTWHLAAMLRLCIPAVGAKLTFNANDSVGVVLHVAPHYAFEDGAGTGCDPVGMHTFLKHPLPRVLAFDVFESRLSMPVGARIALAAIEDGDLFHEVGGIVREAVKRREQWVFPPVAAPCDLLAAVDDIRSDRGRERAQAVRAKAATMPVNPSSFA